MFKQLGAVILMSLQTLPQRIGASSVIVIGIAGVVAVLVSVLAMGAGFRHTLADTGRADRVIILRGGSDAELNSNLTRTDVDTISNAPGLAKDAGGRALAVERTRDRGECAEDRHRHRRQRHLARRRSAAHGELLSSRS